MLMLMLIDADTRLMPLDARGEAGCTAVVDCI